mmetsp:Transcript_74826/g.211453  ORF Transcript_74826/g.211453 Transcript_74826/m.211453 type:complete len:359 (-) Transcript_74826:127-1203(-)
MDGGVSSTRGSGAEQALGAGCVGSSTEKKGIHSCVHDDASVRHCQTHLAPPSWECGTNSICSPSSFISSKKWRRRSASELPAGWVSDRRSATTAHAKEATPPSAARGRLRWWSHSFTSRMRFRTCGRPARASRMKSRCLRTLCRSTPMSQESPPWSCMRRIGTRAVSSNLKVHSLLPLCVLLSRQPDRSRRIAVASYPLVPPWGVYSIRSKSDCGTSPPQEVLPTTSRWHRRRESALEFASASSMLLRSCSFLGASRAFFSSTIFSMLQIGASSASERLEGLQALPPSPFGQAPSPFGQAPFPFGQVWRGLHISLRAGLASGAPPAVSAGAQPPSLPQTGMAAPAGIPPAWGSLRTGR